MFRKSLLLIFILAQCTSSPRQEEGAKSDSLTLAPELANTSAEANVTLENNSAALADLNSFVQYPFETDHIALKKILDEDTLTATMDSIGQQFDKQLFVDALETFNFNLITIKLDSSFVFIADKEIQSAVGADVVCSADIRSPKFRLNNDVSIGMSKNDFLKRFHLSDSLLVHDEPSGKSYYENKQPHNTGFTDSSVWLRICFTGEVLTRLQYETFPCVIDRFE